MWRGEIIRNECEEFEKVNKDVRGQLQGLELRFPRLEHDKQTGWNEWLDVLPCIECEDQVVDDRSERITRCFLGT
jgi:hypothetical protein